MPVDFHTVENGKLVHYIRTGDCNRCGECCGIKNTITYQIEVNFGQSGTTAPITEDGKDDDWSELEGYTLFWTQHLWWYFKVVDVTVEDDQLPCSEQDQDTKLCNCWNSLDEFPAICRYWPFRKSDLEPFPNCGFEFIRQDED